MNDEAFFIPLGVMTKTDVARLVRELDDLEDNLRQAHLHQKPGSTKVNISQSLRETAHVNNCDLKTVAVRTQLRDNLNALKKSAPVMHISFATSPKVEFLSDIAGWFRREVHPHSLLEVGLQPSIAAGCVLRTTNKYFDFSLRRRLLENNELLTKTLREKLGEGKIGV